MQQSLVFILSIGCVVAVFLGRYHGWHSRGVLTPLRFRLTNLYLVEHIVSKSPKNESQLFVFTKGHEVTLVIPAREDEHDPARYVLYIDNHAAAGLTWEMETPTEATISLPHRHMLMELQASYHEGEEQLHLNLICETPLTSMGIGPVKHVVTFMLDKVHTKGHPLVGRRADHVIYLAHSRQ